MAQMVKNLPTKKKNQVQSLDQEGSPGEGNRYPLQYSCLEDSMDSAVCQATVHGAAKSWTQPSD